MKHLLPMICFLGIVAFPVYGAFDYPAFSARNAALSNSYPASTTGKDGFILNPSLTSLARRFYATLSYTQIFNLKELRYANGIAVLPYRHWGLGVSIENFGGSLYSENKLTLNASRGLYDQKLHVGASFHLYHLSAKNYGGSNAWGISVGVQYRVAASLHVGGAIENLNRPAINGFSEELPQTIRFGLQYQPIDEIKAHVAVQKDSWYSPEFAVGLTYRLLENLTFQSGYSTRADIPSAGILLNISQTEIGYAMQYHFDLGETHFFSIAFHR